MAQIAPHFWYRHTDGRVIRGTSGRRAVLESAGWTMLDAVQPGEDGPPDAKPQEAAAIPPKGEVNTRSPRRRRTRAGQASAHNSPDGGALDSPSGAEG